MSRHGISSVLILLSITLTTCRGEIKKDSDDCQNSERQKYFYTAFANNSTSPDYLVFTAVEKQTGISKEICCSSDLLYRAFQNEGFSKRKLDDPFKEYNDILKLKPCNHTFVFMYRSSLEWMGFYSYNYNQKCRDSLAIAIKQEKIDSIFEDATLKKLALLTKYFGRIEDYKKELSLIHYLTLTGIYCGRDDFSGSIVIRRTIK